MFCSKCGSQIPENSNFCVECGAPIGGQANQQYQSQQQYHSQRQFTVDMNKYSEHINSAKEFLISIFKSPVKASKEFSESLSSVFTYSYFAITTFIISLILTLSLKGIVNSVAESLISLIASLTSYGSYVDRSEIYEVTSYLSMFFDDMFPFFKTLFAFILAFGLFYVGIIGISYLVNTFIFKSTASFKSYFVVSSVAITLQSAFILVSLLFSFINMTLAIIVFSVSSILIAIVLYRGISLLNDEHSATPYVFSIVYTAVSLITSYVLTKIIFSQIVDSITSMMYNFSNMF